jgi:hypothetical protein
MAISNRSCFRTRNLSLLTIISTLALGALASGCTQSTAQETVGATAEVTDQTSQALQVEHGNVRAINGTYDGCTDRAGWWSVPVKKDTVLDYSQLTVVKNDIHCRLQVREIISDLRYMTPWTLDVKSSFASAAMPFYLSQSQYQPLGGSNANPDWNAVRFYANAMISPSDFSSDFKISLLYADKQENASSSNQSGYAKWDSKSFATQSPPPNYAMSDKIAVKTDANNVVTLALGSLELSYGGVGGEAYVVDFGTLPDSPTFDDVDRRFKKQKPGESMPITQQNPQVSAGEFKLEGMTLPLVRTVIIRHLVEDVPSYQTFRVKFLAPVAQTPPPDPCIANPGLCNPCFDGPTTTCCASSPTFPGCAPPDPCLGGVSTECCASQPTYPGCMPEDPCLTNPALCDPCFAGATPTCCMTNPGYPGCGTGGIGCPLPGMCGGCIPGVPGLPGCMP